MKKNLLTLGALTLTTAITASSLTGCGFSYTLGDSSASEDSRTPHDEDTSNDQSKDNSHDSNNDDKKDKNGNGGDDKNGSSDKNSAGNQSTDPSDYDYSQDYFGFSFYFNTTDESGYELQEVDYDAKNVTELPENITADNFLCYDAFDGNDSIGSEYIITNDDVLDLRYVNNCGGDDYCFRGFVDGEDEFYSALGKLEYFDPSEDEEWELDGGILNYGILYFEEDGETYWVYTSNIFGFDYYLDYDAEYTVIDDQKELDAIAEMVNSEEYNGFVSQEFININEIDWWTLFYSGAGIAETVTDEDEENAYLEAVGWEELYVGEIFRFKTEDIGNYLVTHLGISSTYTGYADSFDAYLEEYDAYYNVRSEAGLTEFKCVSAKRCGNRVYARLVYAGTGNYERMCIIEDSYSCDRIVSNTYID